MPGAPRTFLVNAIILKHMDYGEADRIVTIFSVERGKLRAIARGVRKIRSRKAGHLEPFMHARLFLSQGREWPIITQAQTTDSFDGLRNDLVKIGHASYVVELLERFSSEDGDNPALFHLLLETLNRLEDSEDLFQPTQYFELHMLDLQGFKPELIKCVRCSGVIQPADQFFSAELGGILCPKCGPLVSLSQSVSLEALKYLRHYQRSTYTEAKRAIINDKTRDEMGRLSRYYITFLLERRLNSPDFIKMVDHLRSLPTDQ
ncbi:MAG: DNA repair protein RecO [Anaerolineaceae bacterium]|nr:DNA repair protein RecO [Anaerolineaceae bacterium]MBN2677616.1 DNA repair protein RecO [Anaerolineaceae bacterium]